MSGHERDCHPVLHNQRTGERLPADDVHALALEGVWEKTTAEERAAYHRVRCLEGRDPEDLAVMDDLLRRIKAALDETPCCKAKARGLPHA